MRFSRTLTRTAMGSAAIVVTTAAVATATGVQLPIVQPGGDRPSFQQQVAVVSPAVPAALRVLAGGRPPVDAPGIQKLRNRLVSDQGSHALAVADFAKARSVEAPGGKAFVIPSGSDACLITSDANDTLGGTCGSLSDVTDGKAFVLTPVSADETAVVALVADGQPGPTIVAADGTKSQINAVDNVASAVVSSTSSLIVGNQTYPLAFKPATLVTK